MPHKNRLNNKEQRSYRRSKQDRDLRITFSPPDDRCDQNTSENIVMYIGDHTYHIYY